MNVSLGKGNEIRAHVEELVKCLSGKLNAHFRSCLPRINKKARFSFSSFTCKRLDRDPRSELDAAHGRLLALLPIAASSTTLSMFSMLFCVLCCTSVTAFRKSRRPWMSPRPSCRPFPSHPSRCQAYASMRLRRIDLPSRGRYLLQSSAFSSFHLRPLNYGDKARSSSAIAVVPATNFTDP